jgi:single-strand DNA-binding protein
MSDINTVTVTGNATETPRLFESEGRAPMATFSVAVSRIYTNAQGDRVENVTFIPCVIRGAAATNAAKLIVKGSPIALTGSMGTQRWEKDGQKMSRLQLVLNQFRLTETKEQADARRARLAQAEAPAEAPAEAEAPVAQVNTDIEVDELPF